MTERLAVGTHLIVSTPTPRALLRTAAPIAVLFAVLLAYDTGVLDTQSTKRAALFLATSLAATVTLLKHFTSTTHRLALGIPLLTALVTLTPALLRGAPAARLFDTPLYLTFLALTYVWLRHALSNVSRWIAILWALTGAAFVFSLSAIIEVLWLGGEPVFRGAPVTTLGNPNHLGALLVLLMPAVLACTLGRTLRIPVLIIASLSFFAIALTGSYLAILGSAAILGILASNPIPTLRTRLLVIALLLASLITGLALRSPIIALGRGESTPTAVSPDASEARASEAASGGVDRAIDGRLYLVSRGVEVVASAPLFGVGPSEYRWGFADAQAQHLSEHPEDVTFHTRLVHAHNDPIELVAEFGLVGLITFILGLLTLRAAARRTPLRRPRVTYVPAFAISGLTLFALLSLGHFVLFLPQTALVALIYAACLGGSRVNLPRPATMALNAVALAFIVFACAIALRMYASERLLVKGLKAAEIGDFDAADEQLLRAQQLHPSGPVLSHRGTLKLQRGDLTGALELLKPAAYLMPVSEVHQNLGLALCWDGQIEAGLERLQAATRLDPTHTRAQLALERCQEIAGVDASTP